MSEPPTGAPSTGTLSTGTPPSGTPPRAGGPPPAIAVLAIGGLVVMFAAIGLALLGGIGGTNDGAVAASPTIRPASEAVRQTAAQITTALGRRSIQIIEPQTPYRPGESPSLFAAPRLVLQAVLPDDPSGGYLIVYDLSTPAAAAQTGRDYAGYLSSGVGRVQFPRDARFVLRQVGSTLVFFAWSPDTSPDARTAEVATALESIGEGIPVPG